MRTATLVTLALLGALFVWSSLDYPRWGNPEAPASLHVSDLYLEHSYEDTHTPNVVTSVLADYRGFDTMFETIVVFTAGLACFFIIRALRDVADKPGVYYYRHGPTGIVVMLKRDCLPAPSSGSFERIDSDWVPQSMILETVCKGLIPFIQLFAIYVLAHGHYSPGGGFQAGVIFAASYLLLALSQDLRSVTERLSEKLLYILAASGVTIYVGMGVLALAFGVNFLDYGWLHLLFGMDVAHAHSLGILCVETGVSMTVFSCLVLIFKLVSSEGTVLEGL